MHITTCLALDCRTGAAPTLGRHLCPDCTETLRVRLRSCEDYIRILSAAPVRGATSRRKPGYGSVSPARDDVISMMDRRSAITALSPDDEQDPPLNVVEVLGGWARIVDDECYGGTRRPATLGDALTTLLVSTEWMAAQPWIDECMTDLRNLHNQLRAVCGDSPPRSIASCNATFYGPTCGGPVFAVESGARCSSCAAHYDGLDLVRLRMAQEAA